MILHEKGISTRLFRLKLRFKVSSSEGWIPKCTNFMIQIIIHIPCSGLASQKYSRVNVALHFVHSIIVHSNLNIRARAS
jgi:hypothetical protein